MPYANDPDVALDFCRTYLPRVFANSTSPAIVSDFDWLDRFRGDATFRGNDYVSIVNSDGGFVRSVGYFCFVVVLKVLRAVAERHRCYH